MKRHTLCILVSATALGGSVSLAAESASSTAESNVYRCPGNEYKNTVSAKDAERLGCKKIEGAPVTIIQMTKPRASGTPVPVAGGGSSARIDPVAQRARDSDARRILENELKTEEDRLSLLRKEYNNGQPERQGDEKNYQKYVDRVGEMSAAIARKEGDVAALRRELAKFPPPAPPPTL
ncbi:MAG: hypothetical protein M3Z29_11095 [Pseudomonadota bacterium]|nr:hypothetical protein [Pseudomonadota bacterium]